MKTVAITGFHNEQEFLEVVQILEYTKYNFTFSIEGILDRIDFESVAIVYPTNEQRKLLLIDSI